MSEIKIQTTKEINIAHYSDRSVKMRKLMFKNIRPLADDITNKLKFVVYDEYAILGDAVEKPVKVYDENGDIVLDENGNPVMETKVIDNIKFLRTISPQKISFADWFALKSQIEAQLPATISEEEKYLIFLKEGVKAMIASKGYYHGQLTMQDFV